MPLIHPRSCPTFLLHPLPSTPHCLSRPTTKSILRPSLPQYSKRSFSRSLPSMSSAYFDVAYGGKTGRINFKLYDDVVPATVKNFKGCCNNEAKDAETGQLRGYTDTVFHRIIPQFMLQGGDFTRFNGTGGYSIYGEKFKDENFNLKHTKPGLLSMANAGPNTNGSQFFITTVVTSWLDGKHVVFGEVADDASLNVVKEIEALGTASGKPKSEVKITGSGAS